jgi:peptidoglycan/LPS O-acetylase OafA/YrhL
VLEGLEVIVEEQSKATETLRASSSVSSRKTTHRATASSSSHRADIDGLRAIAVLSVLGFHTHCFGFSGGFVGVDVFFVISGFLICSIILRELANGSFSVAKFYERRCKRILPALIAVLLFCMAAGAWLLSPVEEKHLGKGVMATILSVSNVQFYLQGNYFDRGGVLNPLLMTWSLAVEEQFYLVFPILLMLLHRRARRYIFHALTVGCALSLLLSVYTEFRHPEFNFYLPFTRAWELGAGTLLAVWQSRFRNRRNPSGWRVHAVGVTGLLLIIACVVFYSPAVRFPGYEAIPPVFGTVFLLLAPGSFANRLLSLRPFRAIGQISYSLYLWHWPLLSFAAIVTPGELSPARRAILMLVAGTAATLSFFFLETPFRSQRSASTRTLLLSYAAAIAVVFFCGGLLAKTNGLALRSPALATVEIDMDLDRSHDCIVPPLHGPLLTPKCFPGASSADSAALLGDSHAEAIADTLRPIVNRSGRQLLMLGAFSCPPVRGYTRSIADMPQFADACARFNSQALDLILRRPDVKVVYLAGSWPLGVDDTFLPAGSTQNRDSISADDSRRNIEQGLKNEVAVLEGAGKQVVLIDDWPTLPFAPLDRLRYAYLPMRRLLADTLSGAPIADPTASSVPRGEIISQPSEQLASDLVALAKTDLQLHVVDTKNILCSSTSCLVSNAQGQLYADANHVSRFGAERILAHVD